MQWLALGQVDPWIPNSWIAGVNGSDRASASTWCQGWVVPGVGTKGGAGVMGVVLAQSVASGFCSGP